MMRFMRPPMALLVLACALAGAVPSAAASEAATPADDPVAEARAMRLAAELRCLVCQNQTIADSHAGLAIDLKNQIREQLRAGRTDAEVLAYMVERYGDFILYRPPLKAATGLLWYGPFALLALGGAVVVLVVRRRRPRADAAFTEAQRERAAALLADTPEPRS
jgi:cytochrome c-type biogenesis protein CcmH